MNTLIHLAETWWPLYAVHMVEVSLFILLVWAVDRWLTLETRLRYALYLLALAKVFVPPVLAIPIPAFLVSPATVALNEPVYSGVVSGAVAVSPEPVTTFPPAFYTVLAVDTLGPGLDWCGAVEERGLPSHAEIGKPGGSGKRSSFTECAPQPGCLFQNRPAFSHPGGPDKTAAVLAHEVVFLDARRAARRRKARTGAF